ncbi:hypothetical protein L195_g014167 [Trifolium pratense]|uniref:Uncharacterized protein n=1 Tax=Trifolium pratense TaxID=57577 RepID=A0A2K3PQ85_TRIPR|nr:hypothetical protein L195_g014167 [Trifolium pratense]
MGSNSELWNNSNGGNRELCDSAHGYGRKLGDGLTVMGPLTGSWPVSHGITGVGSRMTAISHAGLTVCLR